MIYLQLFYEFFKAGLFAVGGGLATLPFLYDISAKTGWFTVDDIANMIAISESTPGPIGINMATYSGFTTAGPLGSVIATTGLVAPSIIIIIIVAAFLNKFKENFFVNSAFYGLRPASTALISSAGFTVAIGCFLHLDAYRATGALTDLFEWKAIILAVIVWILTNKVKLTKKWHPIIFIGISAVVGVVLKFAGA